MTLSTRYCPPLLIFATSVLFASGVMAQTSSGPDFTGIWQLNDRQSDSAVDITQRLHAERRRETAPSSRPASASSSGTSTSSSSNGGGGHGGHGMGGGGGGMGGGGMGGGHHGGGGGHNTQDLSSDSSKPTKDPTPPLLADDALLNVQQSSHSMQVDFNNNDRLDSKLDNVSRQSLNSSAHVQTLQTPDGMHVTMDFNDGSRLVQDWARSADGHHMTVTETWTPLEINAPIVFKRVYDRLDL